MGQRDDAMNVGERGKALFAEWEGISMRMYYDHDPEGKLPTTAYRGEPTIGIGHLLTRSERTSGKIKIGGVPIDWRDGLTEPQAWALLEQDLAPAERAVNAWVRAPLNQNEFDSLVSFAFNVGVQAFIDSTLLRLLNASYRDQVPAQLRRWNMDNGAVSQGLINRREKEIALWSAA